MSLVLGTGTALALFVFVALSSLLGTIRPPTGELDEQVVLHQLSEPEPLELQESREEEEEEEEAPPELEREPLRLSLDQLDIALNAGTGEAGAVGDFSLAGIAPRLLETGDLDSERLFDFSELDELPRPIGVSGFRFPRRLLKKPASGTIVLIVELSEGGRVLDVRVDSSEIPAFDDFVLGEVGRWRFTPPTRHGRPVRAHARLPIPIRVR